MASALEVGDSRLRALGARFRQSLFYVPAIYVFAAVVLAVLSVALDRAVDDSVVPSLLRTTVDSGRAMLLAVVTGTITAVAVVFSFTLIAVQLAASQFSPRTLRSFIGDRFQHHVMGVLLGTVVFALLVLSEVQAVEEGVVRVPHISVGIAVVTALASLLALLASVDHTARNLQVGTVVGRVAEETLELVRYLFPPIDADGGESTAVPTGSSVENDVELPEEAPVVLAAKEGWVQRMRAGALLEAVEEGATVRAEVAVGSFVIAGTPIARVWPMPEDVDRVAREIREAVIIGGERTMEQDVAFGVLRLVDVALRALSPGINDPNTAEGVIARLGSIILEILSRDVGARPVEEGGRRLVVPGRLDHAAYVHAAFDQIRLAARDQPNVLTTLVRTLATVAAELDRRRLPGAARLREQAHLVIAGLAGSDLPEADRDAVEAVARQSLLDHAG